jgi:hypothetical protein
MDAICSSWFLVIRAGHQNKFGFGAVKEEILPLVAWFAALMYVVYSSAIYNTLSLFRKCLVTIVGSIDSDCLKVKTRCF